jgi:hypothetical protein
VLEWCHSRSEKIQQEIDAIVKLIQERNDHLGDSIKLETAIDNILNAEDILSDFSGEEEAFSSESGEMEGNGEDEENRGDLNSQLLKKLTNQLGHIKKIRDLDTIIQSCREIKAATEINMAAISSTLLKLYTLTHLADSFGSLWSGSEVPRELIGMQLLKIPPQQQHTEEARRPMQQEWTEIAGLGIIAGGYLNSRMLATQQISRKVFVLKQGKTVPTISINDEPADKEVCMGFFIGKN